MLVLGRKEGEWIEVFHPKSGDAFRFRCCNIRTPDVGRPRLDLAFDAPRKFSIKRAERYPAAPADLAPASRADLAHDVTMYHAECRRLEDRLAEALEELAELRAVAEPEPDVPRGRPVPDDESGEDD